MIDANDEATKMTKMLAARVDLHFKNCEYCGKPFRSRNGYETHMKMYHSDSQLLLKCNICGKPFVNRHNLTVHLSSHTNNRPYKCDICHNTYKLKHHLKGHNCPGRKKSM